MRYVRNPSKLAAEQGRSPQHQQAAAKQAPNHKSSSLNCGFDKRLVGKDPKNGQECCFEEGRARARFFYLVSNNGSTTFNLLAAAAKYTSDNDSAMDVSMGDSVSGIYQDDSEDCKPAARRRSLKKTPVPKALFAGDSSVESGYNNVTNVSTASSTVNESHAVGAPTTKEEETINTKLAMKELSMMFSSPAMGLNDLEPAVEEDEDEEDGDTATFSLVAGLVDENAANNSILAASQEDEGDENDGPHNPDARDTAMPDFDENALRMLEGHQDDAVVYAVESARAPPPPASGFSIFCDEDETTDTAVPAAGFQIYEDNRDSVGDTATFSVLDEALKPAPATAATSAAGFQIIEDVDDDEKRDSAGDTATFSVLGNALKPAPAAPAASAPLHTHEDVHDEEKRDSGGDTATFSVFGDAMKALDESAERKDAGFSIYMDDDNSIQGSKVSERERHALCTSSIESNRIHCFFKERLTTSRRTSHKQLDRQNLVVTFHGLLLTITTLPSVASCHPRRRRGSPTFSLSPRQLITTTARFTKTTFDWRYDTSKPKPERMQ